MAENLGSNKRIIIKFAKYSPVLAAYCFITL